MSRSSSIVDLTVGFVSDPSRRAREIKSEFGVYLRSLGYTPYINGIGISSRRLFDEKYPTNDEVIVVNLAQPLPDTLEKVMAYQGVPVFYKSVGPIRAR